jgi:serine/threonine-protein kinase haspin
MIVLWTGCYSEVFRVEDMVFKISLINRLNKEGVIVQNMSSILSDVINTKRLSDLKSMPIKTAVNYCENFANVTNLQFVWSHKLVFNKSEVNRLKNNRERYEYLICWQSFGGKDLSTIGGLSPSKGLSLISQVIASVAIAEESMEFEHRDLHCSNILIKQTKQSVASYVLNGCKFDISLNGIKATVIDTTFSRTKLKVALKTNCENESIVKIFFNDLSDLCLDDYSDSQLKSVYLNQKRITQNKWNRFWPKTNLIWFEYISQQICQRVDKWCLKYHINSNINYLNDYKELKSLKASIADYDSAKSLVQNYKLFNC